MLNLSDLASFFYLASSWKGKYALTSCLKSISSNRVLVRDIALIFHIDQTNSIIYLLSTTITQICKLVLVLQPSSFQGQKWHTNSHFLSIFIEKKFEHQKEDRRRKMVRYAKVWYNISKLISQGEMFNQQNYSRGKKRERRCKRGTVRRGRGVDKRHYPETRINHRSLDVEKINYKHMLCTWMHL